jgi:signal peptidase complex subunit 2
VKNALDDSARKFLVAQTGFSESHALMNGRLLISTIAVLFSGYAILYDWYHPFPESRYVLICCVALYFIAMAILTLYTSFLEKGCFAAAKQVDSSGQNKANHWKLSSKQKK